MSSVSQPHLHLSASQSTGAVTCRPQREREREDVLSLLNILNMNMTA